MKSLFFIAAIVAAATAMSVKMGKLLDCGQYLLIVLLYFSWSAPFYEKDSMTAAPGYIVMFRKDITEGEGNLTSSVRWSITSRAWLMHHQWCIECGHVCKVWTSIKLIFCCAISMGPQTKSATRLVLQACKNLTSLMCACIWLNSSVLQLFMTPIKGVQINWLDWLYSWYGMHRQYWLAKSIPCSNRYYSS